MIRDGEYARRLLRGRSYEVASCYGMPHVGAFYAGSGATGTLEEYAPCAWCGRGATNAHHHPHRSQGAVWNMHTPWGTFALRPALIAVCGSGTTGCHDLMHGGAALYPQWVWDDEDAEQEWWSGWLLAHGFAPHDPRLYEFGHWQITDKINVTVKTYCGL